MLAALFIELVFFCSFAFIIQSFGVAGLRLTLYRPCRTNLALSPRQSKTDRRSETKLLLLLLCDRRATTWNWPQFEKGEGHNSDLTRTVAESCNLSSDNDFFLFCCSKRHRSSISHLLTYCFLKSNVHFNRTIKDTFSDEIRLAKRLSNIIPEIFHCILSSILHCKSDFNCD